MKIKDPLALIALRKCIEKDEGELEPEKVHDVDKTYIIHVKGTLKRGRDTKQFETVQIPILGVLAKIVNKAGLDQADTINELLRMFSDSEPSKLSAAERGRLVDIQAAISAYYASAPKVEKPELRKGSTIFNGSHEIIKEYNGRKS